MGPRSEFQGCQANPDYPLEAARTSASRRYVYALMYYSVFYSTIYGIYRNGNDPSICVCINYERGNY